MSHQSLHSVIAFGEELFEAFGLSHTPVEYQNKFLQNVAELILESATLRFLFDQDEKVQSVFESWLRANQHQQNFMERLSATYPDFVRILEEELLEFKREAFAMKDARLDNPQ